MFFPRTHGRPISVVPDLNTSMRTHTHAHTHTHTHTLTHVTHTHTLVSSRELMIIHGHDDNPKTASSLKMLKDSTYLQLLSIEISFWKFIHELYGTYRLRWFMIGTQGFFSGHTGLFI